VKLSRRAAVVRAHRFERKLGQRCHGGQFDFRSFGISVSSSNDRGFFFCAVECIACFLCGPREFPQCFSGIAGIACGSLAAMTSVNSLIAEPGHLSRLGSVLYASFLRSLPHVRELDSRMIQALIHQRHLAILRSHLIGPILVMAYFEAFWSE